MTTQIESTAVTAADEPAVDPRVLEVQQYLNATYGPAAGSQWIIVPETGRTGWSTMYGLTRALQHELGIATLSNNFGNGTLSALAAQYPQISTTTTSPDPATAAKIARVVRIVQGGLYSKGYNPAGFDGNFGPGCAAGVLSMKTDMGLAGGGIVTPKVFKALLTMDSYKLFGGGTTQVRESQQWLNREYGHRLNFYFMPCDGLFSREVQKSFMLAIQYELGMDDATATGTFGNQTKQGLADNATFGVEASDTDRNFVRLFHMALAFNRFTPSDFVVDGDFDADDVDVTGDFQEFCALPRTGGANLSTWSSLLVSTGDTNRTTTGADTSTELTAARIATLKANGVTSVGRYLTNYPGSTFNKKLQPGELQRLIDANVGVWPIFQTSGNALAYFTTQQGTSDAATALSAARDYGFPDGTVIYFAVDFDATDPNITTNIIPYFREIKSRFRADGGGYVVGIYGSRNVCTRARLEAGVGYSMVLGMSTGYSGNLGFPLPREWAFDQIQTVTLGSGTGQVAIDRCVKSGRDDGARTLTAPTSLSEDTLEYLGWLDQQVAGRVPDPNERLNATLDMYRAPRYTRDLWNVAAGPWDPAFNAQIEALGVERENTLVDPRTRSEVTFEHIAIAMQTIFYQRLNTPQLPQNLTLGDFGGWGGDLISVVFDYYEKGAGYSALEFGEAWIGGRSVDSRLSEANLIEDADAWHFAQAVWDQPYTGIEQVVRDTYDLNGDWSTRFTRWFESRFDGDWDLVLSLAVDALTSVGSVFGATREAFYLAQNFDSTSVSGADKAALGVAFVNVLKRRVEEEAQAV